MFALTRIIHAILPLRKQQRPSNQLHANQWFLKGNKKKGNDGHYFSREIIIHSKNCYIFSTIDDVLFSLTSLEVHCETAQRNIMTFRQYFNSSTQRPFSIYPLFSVQTHFVVCIIYVNVKSFKAFNSVGSEILIPVKFFSFTQCLFFPLDYIFLSITVKCFQKNIEIVSMKSFYLSFFVDWLLCAVRYELLVMCFKFNLIKHVILTVFLNTGWLA